LNIIDTLKKKNGGAAAALDNYPLWDVLVSYGAAGALGHYEALGVLFYP
jgi:hypothetical protein